MATLNEILIQYGYWGMFVAAFFAASILPFSSEVIMIALMKAGLATWPLIIYGTIGNVLGAALNYWIGTLGRLDWIEKYLRINKKEIDRAQRFMAGRGAIMGFFSFLPVVGDGITVVLGFMRANITISFISVTLGKFLRYVALIYGVQWLF